MLRLAASNKMEKPPPQGKNNLSQPASRRTTARPHHNQEGIKRVALRFAAFAF